MIRTSFSMYRLPLVSKTRLSSSSFSREVDTGAAVAKHVQEVKVASPLVLVKRPAKTTPCLDNIILAHWWRLTRVGGDVRVLFKDVFPNLVNRDKDFFHVLLNRSDGNSCAVPHAQ